MAELDAQTEGVLDKIENLCKDRFSGYLIACIDGEKIYHFMSGTVVGAGLCSYVQREIDKEWDEGE